MASFDALWPWLGLLGAAAWLWALCFGKRFRSGSAVRRRDDLYWLSWLAAPVYMLHQFEEYAFFYDYAVGKALFSDMVCTRLGYFPYPDCPLPMVHFWFINIGLAWLLIPLAAACYRKSLAVALVPWGVIAVNGLVHIALWLQSGLPPWAGQNVGVWSASLLFLPLSLWTAHVALKTRAATPCMLGLVFAVGLLAHVLLFASFAAFKMGGTAWMMAADVLAFMIPLPAAWLLQRICCAKNK